VATIEAAGRAPVVPAAASAAVDVPEADRVDSSRTRARRALRSHRLRAHSADRHFD
jgi:hypothetical protein